MHTSGIGRFADRAAWVALTIFIGSGGALAADASRGPVPPPGLGKVTTLASLTPATGEAPAAGLTLASDGNFYGGTTSGGAGGNGTILRIKPKGTTSVVYSFPRGGARYKPGSLLVQGSDGALYGLAGSRDGNTTIIYRLTLDGQYSQLQSFSDLFPSVLTLGRDGFLYGVTQRGGAFGFGELFQLANTGELTVVASLDTSTPNMPVGAPLEGDDGNFYVETGNGGSQGLGGIVQITPSGAVTTLYEFTGAQPAPGRAYGSLIYDAAHVYMWGTTYDAVTSTSNVFRFNAGVAQAEGSLNRLNAGRLALGPDGVHFYLTLNTEVYSFADGESATEVAVLPGKAGLAEQLLFNAAGLMYGMTSDGGTDDGGTIFKVKNF